MQHLPPPLAALLLAAALSLPACHQAAGPGQAPRAQSSSSQTNKAASPSPLEASQDRTTGQESAASAAHLQSSAGANSQHDSHDTAEVKLLHPRGEFPWLGVELQATSASVAGVTLSRVLPGSPAERAGLLAGDRLIALGNKPMLTPQDVSDFVRQQQEHKALAAHIIRGGKTHLLRVVLEKIPEFEDRLRLAFVGKKAPEIAGVITFQGEAASLKELRGQVVVLEFWASFCQVCRFMGPMLDSWHRKYRPQGAHIFGITTDPASVGLQVARRSQMTYTLASDPQSEVTQHYLASQIPTLFIIDAQGVIRDAVVGYSKERLEQTELLIQKLLDQAT